MVEISKADWKLLRERMGNWQERYMEKLSKEYVKLLSVCLLSRYLQLTTLTSAPVMPESEQIQKSAKYSPLNPEQIHHEYG